MSDITRSASPRRPVDIQIRRYPGMEECDVIITTPSREVVLTCPDYDRALRWAQMECKSYKIAPTFSAAPAG